MTQMYAEDGSVIPVTAIKVGSGVVTQVKTEKKDGYNSVQLGFSEGSNHINKAAKGHIKDLLDNPKLIEIRCDDVSAFEKGQKFSLDSFEKGEKISVSGITKGQGFAGVVKRHGFSGADASHGTKHHERSPGSIGATDAARVFPGKKMPGHMGNVRATIINLEIAEIDKEKGLIMIKGAVPGARNGLVEIRAEGDMKATAEGEKVQGSSDKVQVEEKKEEKDSSKE